VSHRSTGPPRFLNRQSSNGVPAAALSEAAIGEIWAHQDAVAAVAALPRRTRGGRLLGPRAPLLDRRWWAPADIAGGVPVVVVRLAAPAQQVRRGPRAYAIVRTVPSKLVFSHMYRSTTLHTTLHTIRERKALRRRKEGVRRGLRCGTLGPPTLGFGRIVASEKEAPIILPNLV
jgi:hypothetical protein